MTNIRISANEQDHRRLRKLQSHAFSEKALYSQEPIIQDYAHQFVDGLRRKMAESPEGIVPLGSWYNFTTFDLIGDLAFDENFSCVKDGVLNPWIQLIFTMLGRAAYISEARQYPLLGALLFALIPKSMTTQFAAHKQLSADKAARRIARKTDRPDFMSYILKQNDTEKGMTEEEIKSGAAIFIIAGSETASLHDVSWRGKVLTRE